MLSNMKLEELELLSYTDLTYMLLKEEETSMTTANIFQKICDLLEYSDDAFTSKIGDYYTSLTLDKRFVLLDNKDWDLRERHSVEIVIDDDDDELEIEEPLEKDYDDEEIKEDIEESLDDDDLDDDEDELDLVIVDEDSLKEDE